MTNRDLAEKIYEDLNKRGAGLGNFSIGIIKKTLDDNGVKNCSIPVVSSRYVANNDRKPIQPGIYCVIDSHDQKASSYFDGKSWVIDIEEGEHPVKKWLEVI